MEESTLRRLSFIKYVYSIGLEQSKQAEPLSSASLLSFHDSAELFLQLSLEYLNASKNDNEFMTYWDCIKSKSSSEITQKESMRRLNKARVQLKHHGTLPSKLDIESFRATTTNFFNENTMIVFGIEFDSISMLDLIKNDSVKNILKKAQEFMKDSKIDDSLKQISLAFAILIHDYEKRKRTYYGRSPFFFGSDLTFQNSFFMHMQDRELGRFVDKVKESIESIQQAIKILSLGFDYKKYAKFKLLTPHVIIHYDGTHNVLDTPSKISPTLEECKFCFDYVIESAIRLQDFDFDTKEYATTPN